MIFNPHRMFPGDVEGAFRFFCQWVYDASRRGPGKKILCVLDQFHLYGVGQRFKVVLVCSEQIFGS